MRNTHSAFPEDTGKNKATRFVCTQALQEHMRRTGRTAICLEVATSNTSDIEITEPFLRLAKPAFATYLKDKKKYKVRQAHCPDGTCMEVLLMPYNLHLAQTVTFDRKKVFLFHRLTMQGVEI